MTILDRLHNGYVLDRRVRVLSRHLARLVPRGVALLDVGCGDGRLAQEVGRLVDAADVCGAEVFVRREAHLPRIDTFDGRHLPYAAKEFDVVLLVDVLHHADEPRALLAESLRVARRMVLIKDHLLEGLGAETTLRFMDRVGNRRHGVALPFNYWTRAQWQSVFHGLGVAPDFWLSSLGLYPIPARWVFERGLHFIARLPIAD